MHTFTHFFEAAGLGVLGQLVVGMAVLLALSTLAGVVVEPGLGGRRKLLWGSLAFVPFLGGALWFFVGRSRAEPESADSENANPEIADPEPAAESRRAPATISR
ncbi:hypothetical protein GCM10027271_03590 [Saccharopolyspora gloriosae]|uniref:Phospholipase D-like protein n=1 Tax=Saccharopolyspora gloriosae TaxID=455344 RepID=A0A840NRL6_9PSEU|nr:hypothetical protein [Saccharopolyspora gloriosae]MBB5071909.1 hypothetical protein [Saccharopolyspora gloriosae]